MDLSSPTKLKRKDMDRAGSEEWSAPARIQQISFCVSRYGGLAARDDDLLAFKVGNENRASERAITT